MLCETNDKIYKKNKQEDKKLIKEANLYDSAYELFESKGINDTSIDDIVKKAGVAKGTFYLYFKDKYDIIDKIILKKSFVILEQALQYTISKNFDDFIDGVIGFIDYIIEYLRQNKRILKVIHKNLSWGIYRRAIAKPDEYREMKAMEKLLKEIIDKEGIEKKEFEHNLFMIIELTGGVCYSSIILEEPDSIDVMKPILFNTIRKMLTK